MPQEDIDDEDILHAQVIYKDAGRCDVKIKVRSVSNLSLPDNVEDWRGKVLVYKNDEEKRKEGEDKDKNQRNHPLSRFLNSDGCLYLLSFPKIVGMSGLKNLETALLLEIYDWKKLKK